MNKETKILKTNNFDDYRPKNRAKLADIRREFVYDEIIARIGCSMFKWYGFPDDVLENTNSMLMELAINCGVAVFYKVPMSKSIANGGRYTCTPLSYIGPLRNDGTSDRFITHGSDYSVTSDELTEYVIIKNNSYLSCEYDNTEFYSSMLADTDKSERALIRWSRMTPIARANSGIEAAKIEDVLKKVYDGIPYAAVSDDTKMITGQPLSRDDSVLRLTDESAIEKMHFLSEFHYELVRRICNLYNMPFRTTAKSAQNLESEIHNTDIFSKALTPDRLDERKKSAAEFKKIFGWDISVELSEIFKQENAVIDSNVQQEINESNGETGETDSNVSRETNDSETEIEAGESA